jgi:hypothetical protein
MGNLLGDKTVVDDTIRKEATKHKGPRGIAIARPGMRYSEFRGYPRGSEYLTSGLRDPICMGRL